MNKIIVVGCPGSGKSAFSKQLKSILDMPLYHLDLIWNKPDKTTISRDKFDEILSNIFKGENWIIDGNYQRTIERRIQECDTMFLLDYSMETCLSGAAMRVGKKREDMPWSEESLNEEFKQKIINFSQKQLPEIYNLIDKYSDNKNVIIFKNREDADSYLKELGDNFGL